MTDYKIDVNNHKFNFCIETDGSVLSQTDKSKRIFVESIKKNLYRVRIDDKCLDAVVVDGDNDSHILLIKGRYYHVHSQTKLEEMTGEILSKVRGGSHKVEIKAPMPGKILKINISEGSKINEDDHLLVLEAMKMENIIKSPVEGIVEKIYKKVDSSVEKGELLFSIEQQ